MSKLCQCRHRVCFLVGTPKGMHTIWFLLVSFLVAYVCDSSSSTVFLPPTKLLRCLRDSCTLSQMACLAEYVSVMRRWLGDKLLSRRHARVTSKTINLEFERKSQVRCPIFVCNVDALASRRSQDVFYKPPQWDVLWRHLAFCLVFRGPGLFSSKAYNRSKILSWPWIFCAKPAL